MPQFIGKVYANIRNCAAYSSPQRTLRCSAEEARSRARGLYEQAIALGDIPAKMFFARAMARGRFGLKLIPTGMRSLLATAKEVGAIIDARTRTRS
jgi:hypothetical protein